ncbi:Trypsin [Glycomyces sambucus]|uniref:Trypsin n=1 Tax=Glycomyces sambucus TaxID=380244 RepID=A0A1G9H9Z5_9ACTN|nr:serine protease [Glycomyces sambucus]SDL09740.1 Trypsin [Glycomyces sambucus]
MDNKRKHLIRLGAGAAATLGAAALAWAGTAANAQENTPGNDVEVQVIGGQPAEEGQYPWLVGLGSPGDGTPWERQFCGGSVIAADVVLTAAHCVEDAAAEDLVIFSGSVDLESDAIVETAVADLHVAEDYNAPIAMANDWALLKLAEPVDVEPIALGADAAEYAALETAGWGNTGSEYPVVAEWVEVPFVDDAACEAAYPGEVDAASMLCAGDLENGGVDSCQGDSGGPIMTPAGEEQVLVGIVSWGYGCAEAGNPGVYSEIAGFAAAIDEVLAGWE